MPIDCKFVAFTQINEVKNINKETNEIRTQYAQLYILN